MKQSKQRVIAIDYFRGICILLVLLSHSSLFSKPFAYISGAGGLWTSAAEMFLMLSGLTYAIVRGDTILSNFRSVIRKTWRRAAIIYTVNISIVFISIVLALYFVAHGLTNDVLGSLPTTSGLHLALGVLSYSYSIGWATFLMYYSGLLLLAPFVMYLLRTKYWAFVPLFSVASFLLTRHNATESIYYSFGIWQMYFCMGITIGRFREPITNILDNIKTPPHKYIRTVVLSATAIMLATSILLNFNIYHYVGTLATQGWLPVKLQAAYIHLLSHKPTFDSLFMDTRSGLLRPIMALLVFTSGYLIFQKNYEYLLRKTGNFVIIMGRNTLAVFAAQAIAIPVIAAFNLPQNIFFNGILTSFLILTMWLVAQFNKRSFGLYVKSLQDSYNQAKYSYLQQFEDS